MLRILILPILWFALMTAACSKSHEPNAGVSSQPQAGDVRVSVSVDPVHPGREVPADFTGLSFETSALANASYFNKNNSSFVNLVKGLGNGILRVGGNSADKTLWVGGVRSAATPGGVITGSDVDRFFGFAGAVGWKVMYTLNLGKDSLPMAVSEAKFVYGAYADQLLSFEIGNEPDLYDRNGLRPAAYGYTDYRSEFDAFYDGILAAVPGAIFTGPANASNTMSWMVPFVHDEFNRIRLVTQHYYKMGPPTNPAATVARLLDGNSGILSQAGTMRAAGEVHHLGYRIAECNSVYGGGKTGVSNTFAAALWGVDYMFALAEEGAGGVNFHGGNAGPYTPIAWSGGVFSARPLYYGMLFFSKAAGGRLLTTKVVPADSLNLVSHAVLAKDGSKLVTLINKDPGKSAWVTVTAGITALRSAAVMRLTGPGASAVDGIALGGAEVDADGNWQGGFGEEVAKGVNNCMVRVPACSAVLLRLE